MMRLSEPLVVAPGASRAYAGRFPEGLIAEAFSSGLRPLHAACEYPVYSDSGRCIPP